MAGRADRRRVRRDLHLVGSQPRSPGIRRRRADRHRSGPGQRDRLCGHDRGRRRRQHGRRAGRLLRGGRRRRRRRALRGRGGGVAWRRSHRRRRSRRREARPGCALRGLRPGQRAARKPRGPGSSRNRRRRRFRLRLYRPQLDDPPGPADGPARRLDRQQGRRCGPGGLANGGCFRRRARPRGRREAAPRLGGRVISTGARLPRLLRVGTARGCSTSTPS